VLATVDRGRLIKLHGDTERGLIHIEYELEIIMKEDIRRELAKVPDEDLLTLEQLEWTQTYLRTRN